MMVSALVRWRTSPRVWSKRPILSRRKIDAGADFLLVQPTFDIDAAERFLAKADTSTPMFFGVQVLVKGGVAFAPVPDSLRLEIESGRSGVDAAKEMISRFLRVGVNCFYLIAPVYRGGMRDYSAARKVMASFESGSGSGCTCIMGPAQG